MSPGGRAAGVVYERRGEGEPLVLIHGTGGSRHAWDAVQPLLELDREIVTVDLPGFGESPPFPHGTEVTNAAYAERLEQLFDELGISRPHVAGTSLGGHIALLLGARGTARSVVATSPTGFWTAKEARYTRVLLKVLRLTAIATGPMAPLVARTAIGRKTMLSSGNSRPEQIPPDAAVEISSSLARGPGFAAVWKWANRERLGGAPATTAEAASERSPTARALDSIPVTIAWSEKDKFLNPRQAERARSALPNARHVVLTGCGHLASWDDPVQVAEVLLRGSRSDGDGAAVAREAIPNSGGD